MRIRLSNKKKTRGFVLAELIVAIALLALVSGIILQLFLVASTSNRGALDTDTASSEAVTVMERLRILSFDEVEADPALKAAKLQRTEDSLSFDIYYDSDWEKVDAPLNGEGFTLHATVQLARRQAELGDRFSGQDSSLGEPMQAAYLEISVKVLAGRTDNNTGETYTEELVNISSGKYTAAEVAA